MGRVARVATLVTAAALVVVTALSVGHAGGTRSAAPLRPAPMLTAPTATTYTIDGHAVHMPCRGQGRVPVVFLAGGADPGTTWDGIVSDLGPDVLACEFDRPGVAPSDSTGPVTPGGVARVLAATIRAAHLGRRVVLVAHSIGGLDAVVFGATYPRAIAGAVLIDATVPDTILTAHDTLNNIGYDYEGTVAQVHRIGRWPPVPLVVYSHDPQRAESDGSSQMFEEEWVAGEKALARLSRRGHFQVVPNARHYVYRDDPSTVEDAIRRVVRAAR
jgi:predicted alpha/beta hydrolase family esterase